MFIEFLQDPSVQWFLVCLFTSLLCGFGLNLVTKVETPLYLGGILSAVLTTVATWPAAALLYPEYNREYLNFAWFLGMIIANVSLVVAEIVIERKKG